MNDVEYAQWTARMRAARGRWNVDEIHDGRGSRGLLLHMPDVADQTKGNYVLIQQCGLVEAGTFEGAVPHVGESIFQVRWSRQLPSFEAALTACLQRMGRGALLAVLLS